MCLSQSVVFVKPVLFEMILGYRRFPEEQMVHRIRVVSQTAWKLTIFAYTIVYDNLEMVSTMFTICRHHIFGVRGGPFIGREWSFRLRVLP